jgi:hypothetical protein
MGSTAAIDLGDGRMGWTGSRAGLGARARAAYLGQNKGMERMGSSSGALLVEVKSIIGASAGFDFVA